jgi:hypothetical protein
MGAKQIVDLSPYLPIFYLPFIADYPRSKVAELLPHIWKPVPQTQDQTAPV